MHRDQLLAIDSDFFAAGIRTGAGITSGTMKRIKEEANKKPVGQRFSKKLVRITSHYIKRR